MATADRPAVETRRLRVGGIVDRSGHYGREALAGISRFASEARWQFDLQWTNPAEALNEMRIWQGDGVIGQTAEPEWLLLAMSRGIPAIQISNRTPVPEAVRVIVDDHAIGKMAAEFLLKKQLPVYACWAFEDDMAFSAQRKQGFMDTMRSRGVEPLLAPGWPHPGIQVVHEVRKKWLSELPRPAGIFCVSDTAARTMALQLRDLDIRVPEDVGIIGVDNDPMEHALAGLELTSLDVGFDRVGYRAAALLDQMMRGEKGPAEPILVPPLRVVERRSTDTLATTDPLINRAVRFIREHANRPLGLDDLAEATGVSRRSIQRRFQEVLGRSPQQQILMLHIERAKRLMTNSQYTLAEVAERSGFTDHRSFSMTFRKVEGKTPSAYRKEVMSR